MPLVITRRHNQSVVIGSGDSQIRITVDLERGMKGRECRLVIEAPRDLTILRDELEGTWKANERRSSSS